MPLDLSSLETAVERLEESLRYATSPGAAAEPGLQRTLKAGAIQAFEFTYELACKTLRRYLAATEISAAEVEELSFPDLIRLGCRRGILLSELSAWKLYREQRSITSHTYDSRKADRILLTVPDFLKDVRYLLERLRERADH